MPLSVSKTWHHLCAKDVTAHFHVNPDQGLDAAEITQRTAKFGPNALTARKGKTKLERFLLQFHQPLIYILIAAGVITALLGEMVDSTVIMAVVLVNAVVGYIQEAKAAGALEALAKSMITEAVVIRSGNTQRVPAEELTLGDVVILRSGDKVPADLRLFAVKDLRVDESALTGESLPVDKNEAVQPEDAVLGDRRNMGYASTLVTYGQSLGVVVAIGDNTEIGRISTLVAEADELDTPLTQKIASFSNLLLKAILALSVLTFIVGVLRGEKVTDMFMAAVALAVGAIPEGLPAAVTVILAMGVSRMASRGAIIRKLPAVETLGSASVICTDKTGTLTENQMTVTNVYAAGGKHSVSGTGYRVEGAVDSYSPENKALHRLLVAGLLCNDTRIEYTADGEKVIGDPTEAALLVAAFKAGMDLDTEAGRLPRLDTLPFESEHQYMATLHDQGADQPRLAFFKGSVETALERATQSLDAQGNVVPLTLQSALGNDIRAAMEEFAANGMRVLAIAYKELPAEATSVTHADVENLVFIGLQAMIDPPRAEAITAVATFQRAGVKVKMITGDHAVTAAAIGAQLGLKQADGQLTSQALTGAEMARMSDAELIPQAMNTAVFARVAPDQKLRLVMALQGQGEVVAMTGDGVNDAPALKQADIGVAMGRGGTEAAKEASDMVLTDDNFATIEAAVEEGRGVYDNLLKFIVWTLPTNLGEGLVILVAVFLGVALPITAVQILWINMTTAGSLGLMLAFEPKEPGIMDRFPRNPALPILDRDMITRIFLVSLILTVTAFALYAWELAAGADAAQARTVAVNVFVMIEAAYLFNSRSFIRSPMALGWCSNPWIMGGVVLTIFLQLGFTYAPVMNRLFGSAPIGVGSWLKILAVSLVAFVIVEMDKKFRAKA